MQTSGGGESAGASHAAATYRGMRSRHTTQALGEINVTPLVDVVLVLLLVFMVTAPMMSRGIDVSLPIANQPQIQPEDRLTVSIDQTGRTFIGEKPVHVQLLEEEIRGRVAGMTTKVVYLSADQRLNYGKVIEVVDILKKAGVDQFGLAYDLPKAKPQ